MCRTHHHSGIYTYGRGRRGQRYRRHQIRLLFVSVRATELASSVAMSMPEYLARELINMNIAKWSGTLEQYKEDDLRSTPGLYEAAFCKHNQLIAAKQVLEGEFSCYPVFSKNRDVQMKRMIEAAKTLVTEKPLTIDEKISALTSLSKKPKAGQVVYWPNGDGVKIPMDAFGFLESIKHNWR